MDPNARVKKKKVLGNLLKARISNAHSFYLGINIKNLENGKVFCEKCNTSIKISTKNDISKHVKSFKHQRKLELSKIRDNDIKNIKKNTFENELKKKECFAFINDVFFLLEKSEFLKDEYISSIPSDSSRYQVLKALQTVQRMKLSTFLFEESQQEENQKNESLLVNKYNITTFFPILRKAISKLVILEDEMEKKKVSRIIGRFLAFCQKKNFLVNERSINCFEKTLNIDGKTQRRYKWYLKRFILDNINKVDNFNKPKCSVKKPFFKFNHIFGEDAFKLTIDKLKFRDKKAFCISEILYESGCELKELLQLTKTNLEAYDNKHFLCIRINKSVSMIKISHMAHTFLKKSDSQRLFQFDDSREVKVYLKQCYEKNNIGWIDPHYWKQFKALRILRENGFKDPVASLQNADSKKNFNEFLEELMTKGLYDKLSILKKFIFKNNMRIFNKSERKKYSKIFKLYSKKLIEKVKGGFSKSTIESLQKEFTEENDQSNKELTKNKNITLQVLGSVSDELNLFNSPTKYDISMDFKKKFENNFNEKGNIRNRNEIDSLGFQNEGINQ